jgi:hypothetical protein
MRNKKSICILYGFCEGPRIGKRFEDAVRSANFRITRDPQQADVIVAHSGGCFILPKAHHAQLILLIGLPYWPGKSIATALLEKIRLDISTHRQNRSLAQWLRKTTWNSWYFWNTANNRRMLLGKRTGEHWQATHAMLVRNRNDVTCTPDPEDLHFEHPPALLSLFGQHDDCWIHPETYLAIIQAYYGHELLA